MTEITPREMAVVLDMPPSVQEPVLALRRELDPERVRFPVEITLVGSSGVGPIRSEHGQEEVIDAVSGAFDGVQSFSFRFSGVTCFPNTQVYYLEPGDRAVFDRLHQRLMDCGLRYQECPFPYTPHCTICELHAPAEDDTRRVERLTYPEGSIQVTTASLWSFESGYRSLCKVCEFELVPPRCS